MSDAQTFGIALGLGVLGLLLLLIFIKANIVICQPNEILILAGRKHRQKDGTVLGYRVIRGGRGFKWPFLESVSRLSLTTTPIEVRLPEATSAGMIPIAIEGRANVKLAGRREEGLENAIERFLGKPPDAVVRSAEQTLEGALRGIVAGVTPEDANASRLDLADQVAERARRDLGRLGIVLDFFHIQHISDQQGYLEAIGRKRNAEVRRDANIAEARAKSEARRVTAEQERIGREAEIEAETSVIERENRLAVLRATLKSESNRAEQRAEVAGQIARVEEEIQLEANRVQLSEKQEEARTIVPARARREALMLEAQGHASRIMEDGKATAEAVALMRKQWQDGDTRDLFLIQMLPDLLDTVTKVVAENLHVDKLTILDGGGGDGLPNYVKNLVNSAVVMIEQMKNATGVDLARLAGESSKQQSSSVPKELD